MARQLTEYTAGMGDARREFMVYIEPKNGEFSATVDGRAFEERTLSGLLSEIEKFIEETADLSYEPGFRLAANTYHGIRAEPVYMAAQEDGRIAAVQHARVISGEIRITNEQRCRPEHGVYFREEDAGLAYTLAAEFGRLALIGSWIDNRKRMLVEAVESLKSRELYAALSNVKDLHAEVEAIVEELHDELLAKLYEEREELL